MALFHYQLYVTVLYEWTNPSMFCHNTFTIWTWFALKLCITELHPSAIPVLQQLYSLFDFSIHNIFFNNCEGSWMCVPYTFSTFLMKHALIVHRESCALELSRMCANAVYHSYHCYANKSQCLYILYSFSSVNGIMLYAVKGQSLCKFFRIMT